MVRSEDRTDYGLNREMCVYATTIQTVQLNPTQGAFDLSQWTPHVFPTSKWTKDVSHHASSSSFFKGTGLKLNRAMNPFL